jgi:hypothetical protein
MWLFPELLWDRKLIDRTAGRDRGLEFQLSRKETGRTDWSVSYALASSTDEIGGRTVPRGFDERHAVHADWSLHPANGSWRLSLGGLWHSGWPYTPTNPQPSTRSRTARRSSPISTWRTPGELNSCACARTIEWTCDGRNTFTPRRAAFRLRGGLQPVRHEEPAWILARRDGEGSPGAAHHREIHQWPRLPVAGFSWQF